MYEHGVVYPSTHAELPLDELLSCSQVNNAPDPDAGLALAAAGYDTALRGKNPIAAGKAAAHAGFWAARAGHYDEATKWFKESFANLEGSDSPTKRERVATHILRGRTLGLQNKQQGASNLAEARATFREGDQILRRQHRLFTPWDRYAAMLDGHWANREADDGSVRKALSLAANGVWRALTASTERPDHHESPAQRRQRLKEHGKLVIKCAGGNTAAGVVAATRPFEKVGPVRRAREWVTLRILNG
jgi:hypothetical protein